MRSAGRTADCEVVKQRNCSVCSTGCRVLELDAVQKVPHLTELRASGLYNKAGEGPQQGSDWLMYHFCEVEEQAGWTAAVQTLGVAEFVECGPRRLSIPTVSSSLHPLGRASEWLQHITLKMDACSHVKSFLLEARRTPHAAGTQISYGHSVNDALALKVLIRFLVVHITLPIGTAH